MTRLTPAYWVRATRWYHLVGAVGAQLAGTIALVRIASAVEWWHVSLAAALGIGVSYAAIAARLFADVNAWVDRHRPAGSSWLAGTVAAWRNNRPPAYARVGAIFLTCSVGHIVHATHLVPWLAAGYAVTVGDGTVDLFTAAKIDHDWHAALVDLVTANAGAWYWLRERYPSDQA